MIRAEITNYESVEHATIEIDGFTTVQGPNLSGKSATMRAINAALTNQQGTEFISWGKKFCEVHIIAEGLDLLWHKEEGNNYYVINGNKYSKIGVDDPPSEVWLAGYGNVRINEEKHNLQYAEQFNELFLVGEEGMKTSDLVATAYGLDRLYKASDLCNKDQRSVNALLKIRKKDIVNVESDLKKFDGLDKIIDYGANLKSDFQAIESSERGVKKAKELLTSLETLAADCGRLKQSSSVEVTDSGSLSETILKVSKASELLTKTEALAVDIKRLQDVNKISVDEPEGLLFSAEEYRKLSDMLARLNIAESDEKRLAPCGSVSIIGDEQFSELGSGISKLGFLGSSVENILALKKEIETLSEEQSRVSAEQASIEKEKSEFTVCPLCGKDL